MSTLRLVTEEPKKRHPLLQGLPDVEQLERLVRATVDESLDLSARQMAATMVLRLVALGFGRLEAIAVGQATAETIIEARERQ